MQYVLYVLLIGVMFGLVALGDFLLKKLFPRRTGKAVRLPRRSFMIGILMTVFAVFILLFLPLENEWLLTVGAVILLLIGLFLLVYFFRTSIIYDETGFSFQTLTTKARFYRYADITCQQTLLARSGINILLYAAGDEIQLFEAMQGLDEFLNTAFFAWCKERGIDPDTVEFDPRNYRYFPEKEA